MTSRELRQLSRKLQRLAKIMPDYSEMLRQAAQIVDRHPCDDDRALAPKYGEQGEK